MNLGEQITVLEGRLRQLIKEWERFFCGDRRTPPQADRDRLGRRLRQLTEQPTHRAVERFRLEQLQHRFMTFATNWERMLREREEGKVQVGARREAASRARPTAAADEPAAASVHAAGGGDLFDTYQAAKRRAGEKVTVDRATFEAQLADQRRQIEARLGQPVRFEVVVDGDKVKLAARRTAADGDQE